MGTFQGGVGEEGAGRSHGVTDAHMCVVYACLCVQVNGDGQVVDFLLDPDGRHVSTVSAVSEEVTTTAGGGGTRLWLGNLVGSYVSYVDLGSVAAGTAPAEDDQGGRGDEL